MVDCCDAVQPVNPQTCATGHLLLQAMDAATKEEQEALGSCLNLLGKVHTVQGLDDIDALFRHIMDITVSRSFHFYETSCAVT